MPANSLGLTFTAANDAAVAAFDSAVDEYLAFGRDTGRHLKDALAADPEMVMAHVLRGYFFNLMALPALLGRAQQARPRRNLNLMRPRYGSACMSRH